MTTAEIPILTPPAATTQRARPATGRHRDDTRPTRYGPHLTRRAAALGRLLDRAGLASINAATEDAR